MPFNSQDLADLLFGCPESIAQDLDVAVKTVQRWKAGATPSPAMMKLLRMRYGDIAGLLGDDWQGFHFGRDGLLYLPGWKYGWNPHEIKALFFTRQELRAVKADLADLRKANASLKQELAKLHNLSWASKKLHRLVQLEEVTRRG